MRDPEHIDKTLAAIRRVWVEHPDQRLTELIINVLGMTDCPLFYVGDGMLMDKLDLLKKSPTKAKV